VDYTEKMNELTEIKVKKLISLIGISPSKYFDWKKRYGESNNHNGQIPKRGWIFQWEKDAIINYAKDHPSEGYRRLTYMMIDDDIVAVSPSTVYRILKKAGLLNKWNRVKTNKKGSGFIQPTRPHQHFQNYQPQ